MRSVFVLLLLVTVAACSAPGPLPGSDAGDQADAGCADECSDSGRADAALAPIDGGDAGLTEPDAGESPDAGERDAGAADAGCPWECGENAICVPDHRKCVCATGFHDCNGACVADDAPTSCGGRCLPCPASVANASGACVTGQCTADWVCNRGFHRCGDACVPDDSVATCGTRCDQCPSSPNAGATCNAGLCGFECNPGFMLCGGTCVVCPAGSTATACDGASCVATECGPGTLACEGTCRACPLHATQTACSATGCVATACVPGKLACEGACADCPASATATTCNGPACAATACATGARLCGTGCSECPSTGVATTRCEAERCAAATCVAGFHLCGEICVPDDSVDSCGTRCEPCLRHGERGSAACVAAMCEVTCDAGYQSCGNFCAWCIPHPASLGFGCSALGGCMTTACAPGHYACSGGCCPDQLQTYDVIATEPTPQFTGLSFDLDSAGRAHVAWIRSDGSNRRSLYYSVRHATGWQTELIAPHVIGLVVEIEVDGDDAPHVIYLPWTGALRYANRQNGTWVSVTVPAGGVISAALEVSTSGTPHVLVETSSHLRLLRREAQVWTEEVVVHAVGSEALALKLDSAGTPHVLFHRPGRVLYGRGGSSWTFEEISQNAGVSHGLALDASGTVHASYLALPAKVLRYAQRSLAGTWVTEDVVSGADWGLERGSLAVTTSGQPYVGLPVPYNGYATRTASGWKVVQAQYDSGSYTTFVAVDSADRPHLVYRGLDWEGWAGGNGYQFAIIHAY